MGKSLSRRNFLAGAATTGLIAVAGAAAGCAPAVDATTDEPAEAAGQTGTTTWDAQPESVASQVSSGEDYDVVVVGGGNSGMICALTAAQKGAAVCVLEQSAACTNWAGDMDALDSNIQKEKGIEIDKEWVIHDIVRYANGKCDENLIRLWAYNSGAFINWYQEQMKAKALDVSLDADSKEFYPENFYYSPMSSHSAYKPPMEETANSMGSEVAMPAIEELFAEADGVLRFNTKAVELVQDGSGTVGGVIAKAEDGSYVQYNASKGVVLATGGFAGNKDMMDELGVVSHKYCSNHVGGDGRNGDGIKFATWAGADRDASMAGSLAIFDRGCITGDPNNGGIGPEGQGGDNPSFWWPGSQPFLRVNAYGKRFCNEDGPYDSVFNLGIMQPDNYWWQVFDGTGWDDVVRFGTTLCSRVVAKEGAKNCLLLGQFYPCRNAEEWEEVYIQPNVESGVLIKADTLEELAEQMDLPKDTFLQTVERYNEVSTAGEDADFHKAPWRLSNVDTPPYYAAKMSGWMLCTIGGIRVNTKMQAMRRDGTAVDGLYMVGLDSGGFFNGIYPQYYGGLCLGHNNTFAWLAAHTIMGEEYPVEVSSTNGVYGA